MSEQPMVTDREAAEWREEGQGWHHARMNRLIADRDRWIALADDIWGDLQALEGGVSHGVTVRLMQLLREAHDA